MSETLKTNKELLGHKTRIIESRKYCKCGYRAVSVVVHRIHYDSPMPLPIGVFSWNPLSKLLVGDN